MATASTYQDRLMAKSSWGTSAGMGLMQRAVRGVSVAGLGLAVLGNVFGVALAAAAQASACPTINNLPVYTPASCDGYKVERKGTLAETKNRYATTHAADTVRRFYERQFATGGWTVVGTRHDPADGEWEYILAQGQRYVKLAVEARDLDDGGGTRIDVGESAGTQTLACPALGNLPVYAPAACVGHQMDQDDGIVEKESRYTTGHAADAVRRFYERQFATGGWAVVGTRHDPADGEWEYILAQGQRYLELKIEQKRGVAGAFTKFSVAE